VECIDLFDFRERFAHARSLAVVGNSPVVLEHENGALIDSHDLVVRFNRARTDDLEDKLGRRTDILVANEKNCLEWGPSPATTLKPQAILCFVAPRPQAELDIAPFRQWVADIPTCITLAPDLVGVDNPFRTRLLTQGSYALYTLLRLLPVERLFLTGFTLYGAAPGGAGKYYGAGRNRVGTWHDLDQEAAVFTSTLAAYGGELQATPEVYTLLERQGHRRTGHGTPATTARPPGLYERVLGRIAWRLLRWGMGLRRSLERRGPIDFEGLKK